jgi:acetylornithine/N-succinyldiaminopimelate aminotransferase
MINPSSSIMPTYYNQMPIAFARGRGIWLWDTEENDYLDALAGIAVCSLGHCHPAITKAIIHQAKTLLHTSNTYKIINQERLAEKLTQLAGMNQAYFCNSGAEANEAAIKLTRAYARKKGIAQPIVITMKKGFHGRTMGTLSASGTERIQIGFEPLLQGFVHVEMNNIDELRHVAKMHQPNVVAIMLEPAQGDGGVYIASSAYMEEVRRLCDENDWLMVLDEVQTGIGRTGKWFGYQHFDVVPDVILCAKALGNGIPIGVCMSRGKANNLFAPGKHGCTFGGSPFVCAVGLAVLETMERDGIVENAKVVGEFLQKKLRRVLKGKVVEVRGRGLMIGVVLSKNCMPIVQLGLKHRLLFNVVDNSIVRLVPPLILKKSQANEIVRRLALIIDEFMG